ncbi:hypothetical protein D3C74_49570 [compost metagenome]
MKGYMICPEAYAKLKRMKVSKAEVLDKLMINLLLEKKVVEVPLHNSGLGVLLMVQDYTNKGWSKVFIPESQQELSLLEKTARNKGMKVSWNRSRG